MYKGLVAFGIILLFYIVGVVYFTQEEGWNFLDSVYFCVIVMTTVGYGDNDPIESNQSKIFVSCLCLLAVFVISAILVFSVSMFQQVRQRHIAEVRKRLLDSLGNDEVSEKDVHSRMLWDNNVNLLLRCFAVLVVWVTGLLILWYIEGYNTVDSIYLLAVSGTTVGLGDLSPQTQTGKGVWIVYLGLLTTATGLLISILAEVMFGVPDFDKLFEDENITEDALRGVDADHSGSVSREEWLAAMVVRLGYADQTAIQNIYTAFDRIDVDKDGELSLHELGIVSQFSGNGGEMTASARSSPDA